MKLFYNILFYLFFSSLIIGGGVLAYPAFMVLVDANDNQTCFCPACPETAFPEKGALRLGLLEVDISGAINNPGIYQLKSGERVADLIDLAGGLKKDASSIFLAKELNLAKELKDEMKLYIPFEGENQQSELSNSGDKINKISINNASKEDLETLSGIGDKRAEDIIENRPYLELSELVEKNVFSSNLFESLKEKISL